MTVPMPVSVFRPRHSSLVTTPDSVFEVGPLLEEGRFGAVHEARGDRVPWRFAVKLFNDERSFRREMGGYVAAGRHPLLLRVHEFTRLNGVSVMVMDLCSGDLYGAIQSGQQLDAGWIAAELSLALEHLHRHGVAHLDVKPENVLCGPSGHVRLADLGSSRRGGRGGIGGTRIYLSPEQLFRLGGIVGPASDFWQFGCILYEMFSGVPPYFDPRCSGDADMGARMLSGPWQHEARMRPPRAAAALLDELLVARVDQRLTDWKAVRAGPYFKEMNWRGVRWAASTPGAPGPLAFMASIGSGREPWPHRPRAARPSASSD